LANSDLNERFIKARYFFGKGDFRNAAQHCRQILAEDDKCLDAIILLGTIAKRTGAHARAVSVFEHALTLDANSVGAHLGLGSALAAVGKWDRAASVYEKAIALDPKSADARIGYGTAQIATGDRAGALASFEECLGVQPSNEAAAFMAAALRGQGLPPNARTIRTSFDRYAETFEGHLVDVLGYRMPFLMAETLTIEHPSPFAAVLDLGCGTGLMGDSLSPDRATVIDGVDLAPRMIEVTRRKGRYGKLVAGDIVDYLRACTPGSYDLVVSADVFIYVGPLEPVFSEVARVLSAGSLFCFSVEHTATDDYEVQASSRYAHGVGYIDRLSKRFGYERVTSSLAPLRHENGSDIIGRLELLRRVIAPD